MAQQDNSQKIFVITGCSKGIGSALAHAFIAEKWLVFGCARSQSAIDELNKQYPNKSNKNIPFFTKVDATDFKGIKSWADSIISAYGAPTIVFANAGVAQQRQLLEETEISTFNTIIDVNVRGPFYLVKAFVACMKKANKPSAILVMSSGAGRTTPGLFGIYCCSKWGVEGLFGSLAKELEGTNVMAATYDPGMIGTDMFANVNKLDANKIDNTGIPTTKDFVKESVPQLIKLLDNVKENNGKQLTTPIMSDPKYKDKVGAAIKIFVDYDESGGGKTLTAFKAVDGDSDAKQDS